MCVEKANQRLLDLLPLIMIVWICLSPVTHETSNGKRKGREEREMEASHVTKILTNFVLHN